MSTTPDGRWLPGFGAQFSLVSFAIGGGGLLSGFVFFFIGWWARRPDWWIPGPIYLVAGPTFLALSVRGPVEHQDAFTTAWVAVFLSGIAHAVIIVVLLRRSTRYRLWGSPKPAPLPPPPAGYALVRAEPPALSGPTDLAPPPEPVGLPVGLAPPPGDYYGPGPAARTVLDIARPAPIDVNSAEARHITTLPGFHPDRVKRVLAERRARRGFGSIEEFAAAASLAPHEFVRIRDLVVCNPLPPTRPNPPAQGRILDV
ncbi:helix-hairpin-helix domain-containing protein [Actinomycetes bacterium KLBMP 9797]